MIKTIYLFFFVSIFSLGLWACTGKEEPYKNLTCAEFAELINIFNENKELFEALFKVLQSTCHPLSSTCLIF